jgi:NADH dehydrogenase
MTRLRPQEITIGIASGLLAAFVGLAIIAVRADEAANGLVMHFFFGAVVGIGFAWLFRPAPLNYAESLMSGLAFGLLWWVILSLNLIPIVMGEGPQWEVEAAASAFPALITWLFEGAIIGLAYRVLSDVAFRYVGLPDEPVERLQDFSVRHRIVIVGGGFAGVTTAQHLERLFSGDESVRITLIGNTNHFLFTPMLSEVTAGGIEAQHIITPLRAFFRRAQVTRGEVQAIDFGKRQVKLATDGESSLAIPFDHLVLALGSATNFFGLTGVEGQAFTFKSLEDAILLRNHVIEMLERADAEPDSDKRKALVTFVVAGGGFAGTELIGGLNDFVRGSLWFYPNINPDEVALILVHSGERIMPELSAKQAQFAFERLKARGVMFKLRTRLVAAHPGMVMLIDDEEIRTETVVWTAGASPHPLVRGLGLELDQRGAVKTDATLAVVGRSNVWAVGDCAAVLNSWTGEPCPPTAQHAVRQAATLARNIHAVIRGGKTKRFSYRSLGSFAVLGYQTACADVCGIRFCGLFAWWLWRTIYLLKLPSLEKRIRVALDWTVDLFFPRDIVQTMGSHRPRKSVEAARDMVSHVRARKII